MFGNFERLVRFDKDDGAGSDPVTEGVKTEGAKTFTQDEVNAMVGKVRGEGRTAASSELLKQLGVETIDEAKAALASMKEIEDAKKSEVDKALALASKSEAALATANTTIEALNRRVVDTEIKIEAARVVMDKDGKTVTRPAFRDDALDDVLILIKRDGIKEVEGKQEGIDKALAALATAKPFLLKPAQEVTRPAIGTPFLKTGAAAPLSTVTNPRPKSTL